MAINYQWQLSTDGGETYRNIEYSGTSLTITEIKPTQHNYMYRCRMNRGVSKKYRYSKPATLKVLPNISITNMPAMADISAGNLSLQPTITSDLNATTSFQWEYSDNQGSNYYDLVGQTSSGLSLSNLNTNNNNWIYRLKATTYYFSGITNTVYSNNVTTNIFSDVPTIQIWRQPQNYYGTSDPTFDVVVSNTEYDANGIPTNFYGPQDGISYSWQYSANGGKQWRTITDIITSGTSQLKLSTIPGKYVKNGYQYRVNVSKDGHTILSESASAFDSFDLPDLSPHSNSIMRNYYSFNRINGVGNLMNAQFFCNNPQNSQGKQICQNKLRLLTINYNHDTYDLVLDYYNQIDSNNSKDYFIKDVILYKNNQQVKSASSNYTRVPSSETINNISPTSISYLNNTRKQLTSQYIGLAGKSYGKGYCINFNTTLTPSMLVDRNYIQLLKNSIIKCSSKKYGSIKVAITTTGRSDIDTQYLSSLPKVIKVLSKENNIIANVNVSYTILPNSNTFDGSLDYDVVILNNSYNWAGKTYANSEQIKLRQYVADGGGLITGEWVLWNAAINKFRYLQEVFPIIPTTRYNSNRKIRLYQYDADETINYNVDKDFSFAPANVAGTQTLATVLDRSADLFYVNEVSKVNETSETVYFEETEFNILDIFKLTATPTNEITSSTIGKTYNCKYTIGPKIDKDIYIGGMLYWIYKSLIEHYKQPEPGLTKPASPWDGSRSSYYTPDGTQGNQLNDILSQYGLTFEKFYYNPGGSSSQYEFMTRLEINNNFWKDLSKVFAGLKPVHSLSNKNQELKQNRIEITKQPAAKVKIDTNSVVAISCTAVSSEQLPITYSLQKQSGAAFAEIDNKIFTGESVATSGIDAGEYQIVFSSPEASNKTTNIFSIISEGTPTPYNDYDEYVTSLRLGPPTIISGTASFVMGLEREGSNTYNGLNYLINWQYSYDNKNFYNITNQANNYSSGIHITGSDLVLDSGNYNTYIRYSQELDFSSKSSDQENLIEYSDSVLYNPENSTYIYQQISNTYSNSGIYYVNLDYVFESDTITNVDNLIWQQYNENSNTYENIPNVSGYSVLKASGIPVNLLDNLKFRASINDRIFYA